MAGRQYVFVPDAESENLSEHFSVVSYNILAECHLWKTDLSYTKSEYVTPSYRHSVLMEHLVCLDGDIVCLQEVTPSYYTHKLKKAMEGIGYSSAGFQRRSQDMDEGEATFFRTNRFSLVECTSVLLSDLAFKEIDQTEGVSSAIKNSAKQLMDRADVILISVLRLDSTGQMITLGNVHIWWDELKYPNVKSFQMAVAVKATMMQADIAGSPAIICGDFNSTPDSTLYELATRGCVSPALEHKLQESEQSQTQNRQKSLVTYFRHCFALPGGGLTSAYGKVLGREAETCAIDKNGVTLDYVFFDNTQLGVVAVLDTVEADVTTNMAQLLGRELSSDHLSIKAEFGFRTSGNKLY